MLYRIAKECLQDLFESAVRLGSTSNASCLKLCHFIDQCRKSKSSALKDLAFSEETCIQLLNFYIEWTEKYQQKSSRNVLELLATLLGTRPEGNESRVIKERVLQHLVLIISHGASQPKVKPAFKAAECFLSKGAITVDQLAGIYMSQEPSETSESFHSTDSMNQARKFPDDLVSETFEWICLADISPAAGKFLVTLFKELRKNASINCIDQLSQASLWQQWIRRGLQDHPDSLENIKRHLFPPLFRFDRDGSIEFLQELTEQRLNFNSKLESFDADTFLWLAAMEVGKKCGLVEAIGMVEAICH